MLLLETVYFVSSRTDLRVPNTTTGSGSSCADSAEYRGFVGGAGGDAGQKMGSGLENRGRAMPGHVERPDG